MTQRAAGTVTEPDPPDAAPGPTRAERRRGGRKAERKRGREEKAEQTRAERRRGGRRGRGASADPEVEELPPPTPVATPEGDGESPSGRSRRDRRRRQQRRRFWLLVMPGIALVLAALVGLGAWLRDGDGGAAGKGGAADSASKVAAAGPLLLTHVGADGRADLLVVIGPDGEGDGSVLLVPTATQVEVPSLGLQALADLPRLGDAQLLTTTMENMLGVRIGSTAVLDDAQLAAALAPAGKMDVNLRKAVRFAGDDTDSFAAGPRRIDTATAARLLTAAQTGSELDRLVTVQAVLEGWLARLRDDAVARGTVDAVPQLPTLVAAATTKDQGYDTVPVDSVGTPAAERFEVQRDRLREVVSRGFPRALLGVGGVRPRVEILNGVGTVGVAQRVAKEIVPAGAEVLLTDNYPGFGVTETQVVYYRDADRAQAERLREALGVGSVRKADRAIGVVDITIVVGSDFAPPASG